MLLHVHHKLSLQVTRKTTLVACVTLVVWANLVFSSLYAHERNIWLACIAVADTHVGIQLSLGITHDRAMGTSVALVTPEITQILMPKLPLLLLDCLFLPLGTWDTFNLGADVAVPELRVSC